MSAMGDHHSASIHQPTGNPSRRVFGIAVFLLALSSLLFLCQLVNFVMSNIKANGINSLPISIRATSRADYSRDAGALYIPPISGNILGQIITDVPATGSSLDRLATLQAVLSLPVSTMTPNFLLPGTQPPATTQAITSYPTLAAPTIAITIMATEASTALVSPEVTPAPTQGSLPTIQPTPNATNAKPGSPPGQNKPPKPTRPPRTPKPPKN